MKSYLPVIVRYIIMALASALATRGWLSPEHQTILGENMDVLVGGLVAVGTVIYELVRRPSEKAMKAAKVIDKEIPARESVVIKTPGNAPDIFIHPTGGK